MADPIAQWIPLRLPSCRPGFKSHAQQLRFIHFKSECRIYRIDHSQSMESNTQKGKTWPVLVENFETNTHRASLASKASF